MIQRLPAPFDVLGGFLARGSVVLACLVLFVAFAAFVLPPQDARLVGYAGDAGVPDLSFHYSALELAQMAEAYGPAGRDFYVETRFTYDALWPLIYAVFLLGAIGWAGRLADAAGGWMVLATGLPVAAAAFDYAENLSVAWVVSRHPEPSAVAAFATFFTMAKWVLLIASFVALAATLGLAGWRRLAAAGKERESHDDRS